MKILFLDQNKWIQLAQVHSGKIVSEAVCDIYQQLINASHKGEILVPLTAANILETSKRNDPDSRANLAQIQAKLSKGFVFRSRKTRLLLEIRNALCLAFGNDPVQLPANWAVVPGFIRAFEEFEASIASITDFADIHFDPQELYLDFMLRQDDQVRRQGHVIFFHDSNSLISRIQTRRTRMAGSSPEIRWRAYAAQLFLDHQDQITEVLGTLGRTLEDMRKLPLEAFHKFIRDIPTLNVESELAVRLEAQTGSLEVNDLGDMQNFYMSIPYADIMVAEKNFVSLAKQARLDTKYGVVLHTKLDDLFRQ
jgi:hypothetical protein